MNVVHKYKVSHWNRRVRLDVPEGAKILSVLADDTGIYVYFLITFDTDKVHLMVEPRYVVALFTGREMELSDRQEFIGTIVKDGLVGHVFEVRHG